MATTTVSDDRVKDSDPPVEVISLRKRSKELIISYLWTWVLSAITAVPCFLILGIFSGVQWIYADDGKTGSQRGYPVPLTFAIFLIVGAIMVLVVFVTVEFVAIFGWQKVVHSKAIWISSASIMYVLVVVWTCYLLNFPFWYYYLDVLLLFTSYVFAAMGFGFASNTTDAPLRKKLQDGLRFTLIEALVTAVALIYGLLLMPVYAKLSASQRVLWRVIVHPLYFEVLIFVPVRLSIQRLYRRFNSPLVALEMTHSETHLVMVGWHLRS